MKRPLLLRCLPPRLSQTLYYRRYHSTQRQWAPLFAAASLAYAPGLRMFDLLVGDVISGSIALTGFYEPELSRRIVALARSGGTLVDIGANMGYFSLLWCATHPIAKAFAFEAAPRNIDLLRRNVQNNALSNRITIAPKAALDRDGSVDFSPGPGDQTGWGGMAVSSAGAIRVPSVRLDTELAGTSIDVLKIDVEGAEALVLRGCEALLRDRRIGTIFFEQNSDRMAELGVPPNAARKLLEDHGYRCAPLGAQEYVAHRPT